MRCIVVVLTLLRKHTLILSLPKAELTIAILLFKPSDESGTTHLKNFDSATIFIFSFSIVMFMGLWKITFHLSVFIFIPYFLQTSCR